MEDILNSCILTSEIIIVHLYNTTTDRQKHITYRKCSRVIETILLFEVLHFDVYSELHTLTVCSSWEMQHLD